MKRYDRAYFDRFYRHPGTRVRTAAEVARRARMVVGIAEYLLRRPLRSVLDVGCGEGVWRAAIHALRPRARWTGVDDSAYVVERFGRARNVLRGRVGDLPALPLRGPYDLVVCADVLNYLETPELRDGLRAMRALMGGVAYLELYTERDEMEGDLRDWHSRPASFYRRLLGALGLTSVGMHCWVTSALAVDTAELERA